MLPKFNGSFKISATSKVSRLSEPKTEAGSTWLKELWERSGDSMKKAESVAKVGLERRITLRVTWWTSLGRRRGSNEKKKNNEERRRLKIEGKENEEEPWNEEDGRRLKGKRCKESDERRREMKE